MNKINNGLAYLSFALILLLGSCADSTGTNKSVDNTQNIEVYSDSLNAWFDEQFDAELAYQPEFKTRLGIEGEHNALWSDASGEAEAAALERIKERLNYLETIDTLRLNPQTKLSYQMAKDSYRDAIANYEFRLYDYPFNQMFGAQSGLPAFMINMHKVKNQKDAEQYIARLKGMKPYMEQLIENVKLRERNGIVPPLFVFGMVLDDSRNVLKGKPFDENAGDANFLLKDFMTKVESLEVDSTIKDKLLAEAKTALLDSVRPAYEQLIATFEDQQKRATADDGV